MPDIEFVDGPLGADADELLEAGPRRRLPRPLLAVAVLAAAALVAAGLIAGRSGTAPVAAGASVTPRTTAVAEGPVPQVSTLVADETGGHLYYVVGDRLFQAGADGRPDASAVIHPGGGEFATLQLVPDPAEDTIWVVSDGSDDTVGGAASVAGFRTDTLRLVARAHPATVIDGAAVLNGALYLLVGGLLERLDTHSGVVPIARLDPHDHGLVAAGDGTGLLYLDGQRPVRIGRWTPSGTAVGPPFALTDASLAVAGGTAWLAGHNGTRASLAPEDPIGLAQSDPVDTGLSAGVQIVATGRHSLLALGPAAGVGSGVSSGSGLDAGSGPLELVCVDTRTGRVAGRAPGLSANVAVLRGRVYEAVGAGVRPIGLGSCPG